MVAKVFKLLIPYLFIDYLYRIMEDSVVFGIICHVDVLDDGTVGSLPFASVVIGMDIDRVGKVDDIIDLTILEQAGIATSGNLLHLPLHRGQPYLVFAGLPVRPYLHTVLGGVDTGLIVVFLVVSVMHKYRIALFIVTILDIVDQSRCLVTLKCEDHLQVIAQVILRQRVVQRYGSLLLTTCHASNEFHTGLVIEVVAGLVGGPVVFHLVLRIHVVLMIVAILIEDVSILVGLDGVYFLQHTDGKLTFEVGGNFTAGITHLKAVDEERHALNGNAGAVVEHIARQRDALGNGKCQVCNDVLTSLGAETQGLWTVES